MIYVFILIILIIMIFICSKCCVASYKLGANQFVIIIGIVLLALSACRYQNVESDYLTNYVRMIEVRNMSWEEVITYSTSILNQVFRKVISLFFESPQWYFFFAALIIIGLFMWYSKKYSSNVYLAVFLFYTVFIYFDSHNITRQCIAVALTFYASKYIFEQKFVKYCLIMIGAILFHTSAIFFFPLYFLSCIKFSRKTIKWYLIITALVLLTQDRIFTYVQRFFFVEYTGDAYGTGTSNVFRLVIPAVCAFIMMFFYKERDSVLDTGDEKHANVILNNFINHGTFLYVLCSILSYTKMLMMSRVSIFFMAPTILMLCYSTSNNSKQSSLMKWVVYTMGVCWFAILILHKQIIPYEVFW